MADRWQKKADNLRQKCRKKGGLAVYWRDGEPVDDPAAVLSTERVGSVSEDDGLIGIYTPETSAADIRADMIDSLAEAGGDAEADTGQGAASETGSELPVGEADSVEREDERPIPDPDGEPAADDPVAAVEAGEDLGDFGIRQFQVDAQVDCKPRWSGADVASLRAMLCERYASAHRSGHAGVRDLAHELMRRLDGLEVQAETYKKAPGGYRGPITEGAEPPKS